LKREGPSRGWRSREAEIERSAPSVLRPEGPPSPALSWAGVFALAVAVDVFLGRWVLLPILVAGFYGGMILLALVTFPAISRWRGWLRRRDPRSWRMVQAGVWTLSMVGIVLLSPWWLGWGWDAGLLSRIIGGVLLALSVAAGAWAARVMGWDRLSVTSTLFPPGGGAEENNVSQGLVVEGPYGHVRNPLAGADVGVIVGTALLTGDWLLVGLLAAFLAHVVLQLPFEERELEERFGEAYRRYRRLVPRFVPRLKPVNRKEVFPERREE
jgi:protein-S-isoprenylcysteine O-methyltransferase Ste14